MSSATARRTLVYFLIYIGAVNERIAATYLVEAGLKSSTVDQLLEEMQNYLQNDDD